MKIIHNKKLVKKSSFLTKDPHLLLCFCLNIKNKKIKTR